MNDLNNALDNYDRITEPWLHRAALKYDHAEQRYRKEPSGRALAALRGEAAVLIDRLTETLREIDVLLDLAVEQRVAGPRIARARSVRAAYAGSHEDLHTLIANIDAALARSPS